MNRINRPTKLTKPFLAKPSNFTAESETDLGTVSKSVPIERSDFLKASMSGNTQRVDYLLKHDIDINQQDAEGNTALLLASERGHTATVQLLLNSCARVARFDMQIDSGQSALMAASQNGHTEVAKLLLDHHAQVDMHDNDGWSALIWASHNGHTEVVKLLLDHHAQVDMQIDNGRFALMAASQNGHREVVTLLLDYHAQVNMQTDDGWSALMSASQKLMDTLKWLNCY